MLFMPPPMARRSRDTLIFLFLLPYHYVIDAATPMPPRLF
jgi:hypothetical protein